MRKLQQQKEAYKIIILVWFISETVRVRRNLSAYYWKV